MMQHWRSQVKIIHALVCTLALSACAAQQTETQTTQISTPPASYHILGRHSIDAEGAMTFAWPASGIEGRFTGARVTATVEDNGENLMDVTVDGVTTVLDLEPGVQNYELFSSATPSAHTIRFTRRSEIYDSGLTTIHDVQIDGAWAAPHAYAHRMLVIGDSLSVGYGLEGPNRECRYSAETGAPLKSYASLTANAFDAELHLIAISGRGALRNWDDSEPPRMLWQIDKALPDQATPLWDQQRFQPELVVINLGANDFSEGDPGQAFDDTYLSVLRNLHAAYPQARIVIAQGPDDRAPLLQSVQQAAATVSAEIGAPIPFLALQNAPSGRVWGCDSHPGLDSHRAMADQLIAFVQREIGWTRAN
jgi:lysophospholipase L1-like esterase